MTDECKGCGSSSHVCANSGNWYTADLALRHYAGNWKSAQELAAHRNPCIEITSFEYWMAARTYFLELGGLCIDQLPAELQKMYLDRP